MLADPAHALDLLLTEAQRLPAAAPEVCPLSEAIGRVLAEAILSPAPLPGFDNSLMDGFALAGEGAERVDAGTRWPVVGRLAAGDRVDAPPIQGQRAWEIMTGAPVPKGLDRMIPVERVERVSASEIRLLDPVALGQHIRRKGSDIDEGEIASHDKTVIYPQHEMLLSALGIDKVRVMPKPKVALLSTGRELSDALSQSPPTALATGQIHNSPLPAGQIHNSSGPFLASRIARAGAQLVWRESVSDEVRAFTAAFERAERAGAQLILSTGAVSMGRFDFVPQAISALGGEILVHRVAIRPGKPLLLARFARDLLFLGLPGNPISSAVGWRFFAEAFVRARLGLPTEAPIKVPLAEGYHQSARLRFHLKSSLTIDAQGQLRVRVLPGQESFRIRPLAAANAWVVTPPETTHLPSGARVDVWPLGHLDALSMEQA